MCPQHGMDGAANGGQHASALEESFLQLAASHVWPNWLLHLEHVAESPLSGHRVSASVPPIHLSGDKSLGQLPKAFEFPI